MKIKDYYSFFARDGLFLPIGSYIVEEISIQQVNTLLKPHNKELLKELTLQQNSYSGHIEHKILK